MDTKRTTPRHIIIKMPKVKNKEQILKAAREKDTVAYKGVPIRLSADFSKETEAGCSQEEGPKKGFVMGSRTRGVQEILEKCI